MRRKELGNMEEGEREMTRGKRRKGKNERDSRKRWKERRGH